MTLLSRYIVDVAEDGVGGLDDRPQIPGIEDIVFDQPRVRVAAPPRGVVVDGASRAEMQRGVVSAGGRGRGGGSTMTEQQGNGTKPNTGVEVQSHPKKKEKRKKRRHLRSKAGIPVARAAHFEHVRTEAGLDPLHSYGRHKVHPL